MFKNLFKARKKSREPKYKAGELVFTQFPKKYFPDLYIGLIVKSKLYCDFTEEELKDNKHSTTFISTEQDVPVYTVLCGQTTRLIPEFMLKKYHEK